MSAPTDPAFAPILGHSRGKSVLADGALPDVRQMMEDRAKSRPGPEIATVRDAVVPGPAGDIPVRLYVPEQARGVVLAYHGGGWITGSRDSFDPVCRFMAAESGAAVVSVDYRLAPEHVFPAAVDDAFEALVAVDRDRAGLGLPDGPIVVMGESAGANLALVVSLMARDAGGPAIAKQVLAYPAVDASVERPSMDLFAENHLQTRRDVKHALGTYALNHGVDPSDWRLSPLKAETFAGLPPVFLVSAECDAIRDDSEALTHRLMAEGVGVVHARYAGMIHTFVQMRPAIEAAIVAQRQMADEVRRAVQA